MPNVLSKPKSTLYFSHFPHLQMGGQKSLLALLERLDRNKYRPFAVTTERGELSEALERLDCKTYIARLPEAKRTYFWQPWRADAKHFFAAAAEIRRIAIDCKARILHPDEESDIVICGEARRKTLIKTVFHVRLTNPSKLDRLAEAAADRFIGVSEGTKKRWSRKALQRYGVIPDGLDCDKFTPPANRSRAKQLLGLPDRFIVLFAGQIKESKGIYDLIEAFGQLRNEFEPDKTPLLLVAGTPLENGVLQKISDRLSQFGINDMARVIGRQLNIEQWMQAADVLALPSHEGAEGLPRVLFEGMACGAAALGTDVSGVREAIPPNTGLLVPERAPKAIASAIKKLFCEPDFAQTLRKNGVESARRRFDANASARAVESVYDELLYAGG